MRFLFLVHIATSYEYHYAILKADRLYCSFSVYLYMYSCLEQQV